jgi:Coenzyme PQQ synthesis protein D (PqqD)
MPARCHLPPTPWLSRTANNRHKRAMQDDPALLSLTERLVPSKQALESRVGDETVLLQLESGTYYGLDPVGTRIWELLKEGLTPQAICGRIAAEYGTAIDIIEADARRFLSDLKANAIVVAA